MIKLSNSRTYIIIDNLKELDSAKQCDLCMHIVYEHGNVIYMWDLKNLKWVKSRYTAFGEAKYKDDVTTGFEAYQLFYNYCGKEEIDRMKTILKPIECWESFEQMHFCNLEYCHTKIYENIFEFDVNSSFSYGATLLPDGFEPLKCYMRELYEKRRTTKNVQEKARLKNLMVYLVGYFSRIKGFVAVRSAIIDNSNQNIRKHIIKIRKNGGKVYLSNTDSIVTDEKGAEIMMPILGDGLGQFKLSKFTDRLYYRSPNSYQIGDKVVYSGVNYFARKHTDLFKNIDATAKGKLIEGYDFALNETDEMYSRICRVKKGHIEVTVYNALKEVIDVVIYKLGD